MAGVPKKIIIGERFGRLEILGISRTEYSGKNLITYVRCMCDCGKACEASIKTLRGGKCRSCGCLKKEQNKKNLRQKGEGLSNTKLREVRDNMRGRCYNPNNKRYPRYGARGIIVERESFEMFYKDMYDSYMEHKRNNPGNRNTTIERKNNSLNYSKSNCTWATQKEQANNRG